MSQPTLPGAASGIDQGTPASGIDGPEAASAAPPAAACANCQAPLVGPYCARCGQRAGTRVLSLHYIVKDAVEDQLSLDSSLPRTAGALLLHPGRLTTEYVAGRIRSYIPPMRLYLSCSVLFFLVLAFIAAPARLAQEAPAATPPATAAAGAGGEPERTVRIAVGTPTKGKGGVEVSGFTFDTLSGPGWLRDRLKVQARHFKGMPPREATRELLARLYNAAPKVAFVLLPFFALILKGLYFRRLYVEHFVFALHLHAAAFLAFTVMLLAHNGYVGLVLMGWLAFYCFHALRVVYHQRWWGTLGKIAVLGTAYFFVLCAGIVTGVLAAILVD